MVQTKGVGGDWEEWGTLVGVWRIGFMEFYMLPKQFKLD